MNASPLRGAVVSACTTAEFRAFGQSAKTDGDILHVGKEGGEIRWTKVDAETRRRAQLQLEDAKKEILASLEVRPATQLAQLTPDRRAMLLKLFGQAGAESLVLAEKLQLPLASDDGVVRFFCARVTGVATVNTQSVLQAAVRREQLRAAVFDDASATLIGFGYRNILMDKTTVHSAGRIAEWKTDRQPLTQLLSLLSESGLDAGGLARFLVAAFSAIIEAVETSNLRQQLLLHFCETIGARPDGVQIVKEAKRMLPAAAGLNIVRASEAVITIDAWLVARARTR